MASEKGGCHRTTTVTAACSAVAAEAAWCIAAPRRRHSSLNILDRSRRCLEALR